MLWMSRKFIIISKICVLLVRIFSKWTFRQVSWKVQEHLWSKKIYQISNSQQTCQYINQLHSELQCVCCEQSHELCTHILQGCLTLDWVSEATLKPVGTYYKNILQNKKNPDAFYCIHYLLWWHYHPVLGKDESIHEKQIKANDSNQ